MKTIILYAGQVCSNRFLSWSSIIFRGRLTIRRTLHGAGLKALPPETLPLGAHCRYVRDTPAEPLLRPAVFDRRTF